MRKQRASSKKGILRFADPLLFEVDESVRVSAAAALVAGTIVNPSGRYEVLLVLGMLVLLGVVLLLDVVLVLGKIVGKVVGRMLETGPRA